MARNRDNEAIDRLLQHGIDIDGRSIRLFGEINVDRVDTAMKGISLIYENNQDLPIKLFINSDGGSIYDANALYDYIRSLPCEVHTYAQGQVGSCATDIYLAGDRRFAYKHTIFLFHTMSDTLPKDTKLFHMEDEVRADNIIWVNGCRIYADRTGYRDTAWWKTWTKYRERYLFTPEAYEMNVVTDIIEEVT